jgi:predicted alpha/beta-hydrolase family hydrolase
VSSAKGLVLFPGAGSSASHSSLIAIEEFMQPTPVGRIDFPYRRAGKRAPDRAPVLLQCVRDEVQEFAKTQGVRTSSLVIGGRSMGGRMCSMAAAGDTGLAKKGEPPHFGDPLKVRGLVLISYPLHPPAHPEKLRIAHLSRIAVPVLFVHGTNDPFGSPAELKKHVKKIPSDVSMYFIEKGRHDLKGKDAEIAEVIREWCRALR